MKKQSPHKKKAVKTKKPRAVSKYHKKIKIDASFEEVIRLAAQGGFVPKNNK